MNINTSELSGSALDWAVLVALYGKHDANNPTHVEHFKLLRSGHSLHRQAYYSSDWSQGGPIVERECIELRSPSDYRPGGQWEACKFVSECEVFAQFGHTPLEAGMRAFVASKLGDVVDVPGELL